MNIGLSANEAGAVAISATGVYAGFLVLVRFAGRRLLGAGDVFDLAAALGLGAIMGRATLGYTPTLGAAGVALATLLGLHIAFGRARRVPGMARLLSPPPVLLVADGRVLEEHLKRTGLRENDLRQKLRLAGIRSYGEVAAAVLERTGAVSVVRRGEPTAPEMFADVEGRDLLQA